MAYKPNGLIRKTLDLKEGADIYPETEIALETIRENSIERKKGYTITFRHCIFAAGYAEEYDLVKDKISITRTFAF